MTIPTDNSAYVSNPQQAPVLLTGLARSGTTWLAKLLDSHPQILYRHEPDSLPNFPRMPKIAGAEDVPTYGASIAEFVSDLPNLNRIRPAGTLPVFQKLEEGLLRYQSRRAVTLLTRLASKRLGNIRIPNLYQQKNHGEATLLWKSVDSVGRLSCIMNAVNSTQAILLIRHPCGIISSRMRGVDQRIMAPVSHGELSELMRSQARVAMNIRSKQELLETFELEAYRWAVLNSLAIEAISDNPNSMIVRYEELCTDTEAVLRRILAKLQLNWDSNVDHFLEQSTTRTSKRFYGLHRQETDVDQWRDTIPTEQQERILDIINGTVAGEQYA